MTHVMKTLASALLFCAAIAGCASSHEAAPRPVEKPIAPAPAVTPAAPKDITTADFKRAVQKAVRNMVRSGALDNPGGARYTVMVSRVANMTKKDIDTDEVAQKIRSDLAVSKKVRVVSGVPQKGKKFTPPEISVSGKITQRTAYVRKGERIEYYLHLNLTETKSGINLWENVTPVLMRD